MSAFAYRAALLGIVVGAHAFAAALLLSHAPARAKSVEQAAVAVSLITPAPLAAPRERARAKPFKKIETKTAVERPAAAKPAAAKASDIQPVIAAPANVPAPIAVADTRVPTVTAAERVETPVVAAPAVQLALASPQPTPAAPAPVVPPSFDAGYLNNPPPAYPPLSRRMREEGRVVLRVFVNERGMPDRVELKASSGHVRLDEVALDTVKHWKFIPARHGETSVSAWVLVPIAFNLRS